MAQVVSFRSDTTPSMSGSVNYINKKLALINGSANIADNIEVFMVPYGQSWRLIAVDLRVDASLGAGATLALQVNRSGVRTVLTPASTAAAASKVTGAADADMPFDLLGGDVIELVVAGANITAAANASVGLFTAPR